MKGPLDARSNRDSPPEHAVRRPSDGWASQAGCLQEVQFRRALRNLFRRKKSKTVRVKAADPRQVKLVLFSWGVAVALLIACLVAFWAFTAVAPPSFAPRQKTRSRRRTTAVPSNTTTISLPAIPTSLALRRPRVAGPGGASCGRQASGPLQRLDAGFRHGRRTSQRLPKQEVDPDLLRQVRRGLGKDRRGTSPAVTGPSRPGCGPSPAIARRHAPDEHPRNLPADKMVDEITDVLAQAKRQVEGRQNLDQTFQAIRDAVAASDVRAAYDAYRDLVKSSPELADDARLIDAMKEVSALEQKAVKVVA